MRRGTFLVVGWEETPKDFGRKMIRKGNAQDLRPGGAEERNARRKASGGERKRS